MSNEIRDFRGVKRAAFVANLAVEIHALKIALRDDGFDRHARPHLASVFEREEIAILHNPTANERGSQLIFHVFHP